MDSDYISWIAIITSNDITKQTHSMEECIEKTYFVCFEEPLKISTKVIRAKTTIKHYNIRLTSNIHLTNYVRLSNSFIKNVWEIS